MRTQVVGFVITALTFSFASGRASAQQTRVVHVENGGNEANLQEMATIIRVMAGTRDVSVDPAKTAVVVSGTSDQVALAQWLVGRLCRPVAGNSTDHEYRMKGTSDDVVRVFYATHAATPQGLQEVTSLVRAVADVPWVFTYNPQRAVAARGTAAQISIAEWLVNEIDKPTDAQTPASPETHEYQVPGASDDVVRVFYLAPSETPEHLGEVAGAVRSATKARRLFINSGRKAVVIRGTPDQVATAERLISEIR